MKKQKKQPSPYFQTLIDHVDASWMKKKGFHYPFAGRDFRDLKGFCRSFREWGVMALWDVFMASDSEWVQKSGYSIGAFTKCIPWLVDNKGWKKVAQSYESRMVEPIDSGLFADTVNSLAKSLEGKK